MVSKEAIEAALTAHSQWKKRLHDAIATGKSDFVPDTVRKDNACDFGKWLYSLPPEERSAPVCAHVTILHAEFHRTAGEILALAVSGKEEEALAKLGTGGTYNSISGKLVLALQGWKSML